MVNLNVLLLVLAFLAFCLGAAGVPSRVGWVPLGLALWVLSLLIRVVG